MEWVQVPDGHDAAHLAQATPRGGCLTMGTPLRVLLVEDSENDALLLLRELKRGGYEPLSKRVDTAWEMEEALEKQAWDLVISDHSMPAFSSLGALDLPGGKGFLEDR